jgi:hypothetical protein
MQLGADMLRHLTTSGFDAFRQGVTLLGRTHQRNVLVVIYREAIEECFPKIGSTRQCIGFVERNLGPLRDMANVKLRTGVFRDLPGQGAWQPDLLIELMPADLMRARRWMVP